MKKDLLVIVVLLLTLGLVNAVSQEELNEAKALIDSKINCDKLTNEQLEGIGEYYMEQMMPGESHERAHEMMGLTEGSNAEKQFHIDLARRSYCGETSAGFGMMGRGMMGNYYPASYDYSNYGYFNIFWILLFATVIFLIVWIIYKFGIKNTSSETPLNILRKRFAKGEITKKEFENMKKDMGV